MSDYHNTRPPEPAARPPRRAAIYVRSATTGQADGLDTLDAQRRHLAEHCLAQGWEAVGHYEDQGVPGLTLANRPGAARLLEDATAGRFDVILTVDPSRLLRQPLDVTSVLRQTLPERGDWRRIRDACDAGGVSVATPEATYYRPEQGGDDDV